MVIPPSLYFIADTVDKLLIIRPQIVPSLSPAKTAVENSFIELFYLSVK